MNELVEKQENQYQIALKSTRILDMRKDEAIRQFADILTATYFTVGHQLEKEKLKFLCLELFNEAKDYFQWLRIDELRIAFKNGSRKEYGDFMGLNIATFHNWVKQYQFSETRKAALVAIKTSADVVDKPTPEQLKKINEGYWETIKSLHRRVMAKESPFIPMAGRLYLNLLKIGLQDITDSKKGEIERAVINKFRQQILLKPTDNKDFKEIKDLKLLIAMYDINPDTLSDEQQSKILLPLHERYVVEMFNSISPENLSEFLQKIQ